jgi:hypothetical protein
MTGTNCDLFTHKSSRSYLNHLVFSAFFLITFLSPEAISYVYIYIFFFIIVSFNIRFTPRDGCVGLHLFLPNYGDLAFLNLTIIIIIIIIIVLG